MEEAEREGIDLTRLHRRIIAMARRRLSFSIISNSRKRKMQDGALRLSRTLLLINSTSSRRSMSVIPSTATILVWIAAELRRPDTCTTLRQAVLVLARSEVAEGMIATIEMVA